MSEFLPEFHRLTIDESDGLLMTVLIGLSVRRRDVYFELHRVKDRYKLYWCFETFLDEIYRHYVDNGGNEKIPFEEFLNSREIQEAEQKRTVQDSCYIETEDEEFLSNFLKNGLMDLDRHVPMGLDGHHYIITIKGDPDREYYAWCVIPKEWCELKTLVEILRKYAGLSERYSVSGIG